MHDESPQLTLLDYCIAITMLLTGIYLVPLSLMHLDLSRIPGDLVDARLNNYFLEHGYKWVTGQVGGFWSAPFFFPAPQVMTLSDNHLGTVLLYSVFRLLDFDRETAYQLWMLSLFSLNYLCAIIVLNRMGFNSVGAAAGAYLFAFSLPISAQLGHIQLLPLFMIPLAFYFAMRFLKQRKSRDLVVTCVCVVVQFYCVIYIGYFLSLGVAFLALSYLMLARDRNVTRAILWSSRKECSERVLVVVGSGAALMPLMYPYYLRSMNSEGNSWETISSMLPRVHSYFYTLNESLMWGWLSRAGNSLPIAHEHRLFMGFLPVLALMLVPLLNVKSPDLRLTAMAKLLSLTLLGTILLTLYIDGLSVYRGIYWVPGVNAIRAPVRIILMQLFLFAALLALAITFVATWLKDRPVLFKGVMAAGILILTVCDQGLVRSDSLSYDKRQAQKRTQAVEDLVIARDPQAKLFLYLPKKLGVNRAVSNLDAMLAAQSMNIYTVNGHSGYEPRDNRVDPRKADFCSQLVQWFAFAKTRYSEINNIALFDDMLIVGDMSCNGIGANIESASIALQVNVKTNDNKKYKKVPEERSVQRFQHLTGN